MLGREEGVLILFRGRVRRKVVLGVLLRFYIYKIGFFSRVKILDF